MRTARSFQRPAADYPLVKILPCTPGTCSTSTLSPPPYVMPPRSRSLCPLCILACSCVSRSIYVVQSLFSNLCTDEAVYPHNLDSIYPSPTVSAVVQPARRPSQGKLRTDFSRVSSRTRSENGHAKRGSASSRAASLPPVPPLPQNVQLLTPINPTSHLPLAGDRVGLSRPVRLPSEYPTVAPCRYSSLVYHSD